MKYPKLTALLGLAQIELHSGAFGFNKPFAKLSEEELSKIEQALLEDKSQEHQETIQALEDEKALMQEKLTAMETAVATALLTAGLEASENLIDNITQLGEKCKEYGSSKERHSFPENDGEEKESNALIDGYLDPNDAHNQLLNQMIK